METMTSFTPGDRFVTIVDGHAVTFTIDQGGIPRQDAGTRTKAQVADDAALARRRADFQDWLRAQGVDPADVLDDVNVVSDYHYMWRTRHEWPAGGTYEADTPRNPDDKIVAHRLTRTVEFTRMGYDPEATESWVDESGTRSKRRIVEETPWVWE